MPTFVQHRLAALIRAFCSGNNIGGHGFCFLVSAVRTGEDRFRLNSSHVFLAFTIA